MMRFNIFVLVSVIGILAFFFCTPIGAKLRLRANGTINEAIDKDAATEAGVTAHYNNAIDKKEEDYRQANNAYQSILGEIDDYEKQLRDLKKESAKMDIYINTCIEKEDDEGAKRYLVQQQTTDEKAEILKETVKSLKENEKIQKENVDNLLVQVNQLKAEKEKQLLILKTSQSTKAATVVPGTSEDMEEKMLVKVREGVNKVQKEATGQRIAYENSNVVQQQRLDKAMKNEDIDRKLQQLKANRNKPAK